MNGSVAPVGRVDVVDAIEVGAGGEEPIADGAPSESSAEKISTSPGSAGGSSVGPGKPGGDAGGHVERESDLPRPSSPQRSVRAPQGMRPGQSHSWGWSGRSAKQRSGVGRRLVGIKVLADVSAEHLLVAAASRLVRLSPRRSGIIAGSALAGYRDVKAMI